MMKHNDEYDDTNVTVAVECGQTGGIINREQSHWTIEAAATGDPELLGPGS